MTREWNRELEYRLIKELWAFTDNRLAVRFAYEYHDDSGNSPRRAVGSGDAPIVVSSAPSPSQEHGPMKYMMFVVADPDAAAEAEPSENDLTIEEWLADVDGRGKRIAGDALRPVSDATTVRVSRGQVLVTDGPFTESKEWIAGFDILECDDLDEAIAIAARHPQANGGKLELRPFWTEDN
jgi:hypothetical protein